MKRVGWLDGQRYTLNVVFNEGEWKLVATEATGYANTRSDLVLATSRARSLKRAVRKMLRRLG